MHPGHDRGRDRRDCHVQDTLILLYHVRLNRNSINATYRLVRVDLAPTGKQPMTTSNTWITWTSFPRRIRAWATTICEQRNASTALFCPMPSRTVAMSRQSSSRAAVGKLHFQLGPRASFVL